MIKQTKFARNADGTLYPKGNDMDEKTIQTIEAIIKRGNDAEVRKKGDGVVILEVKKTIKHST